MNVQAPEQFRHTTLTVYPDKIVGMTLLDETPGLTGIYLRDRNGGLWPARTVDRADAQHHFDVCEAWLSKPGIHKDQRT